MSRRSQNKNCQKRTTFSKPKSIGAITASNRVLHWYLTLCYTTSRTVTCMRQSIIRQITAQDPPIITHPRHGVIKKLKASNLNSVLWLSKIFADLYRVRSTWLKRSRGNGSLVGDRCWLNVITLPYWYVVAHVEALSDIFRDKTVFFYTGYS